MVLVKMLMKITLPKMGELLVMTAVTISPSRREVSPVEQLRRSPRLVPPRFRLETVALHPKSFLLIFSRAEDTLYQKMGIGGSQVAHEAGDAPRGVGRAPTLVDGGWPPSGAFFAQYF